MSPSFQDQEPPENPVRFSAAARDRLIGLAARHPDWVVGYVDEVWWSRLAQPAMHAWGTLRLKARARAKDDAEPDRVFRRLLILEGWSHDQAYSPVFS